MKEEGKDEHDIKKMGEVLQVRQKKAVQIRLIIIVLWLCIRICIGSTHVKCRSK